MWGEQADASDLDKAIWPRAAAVAERLWTPLRGGASATANATAQARLAHFRCLLNQRGVGASPLGMTVDHYNKKTGMMETAPGAFSGLPPRPGSCLQGGVNRTMRQLPPQREL